MAIQKVPTEVRAIKAARFRRSPLFNTGFRLNAPVVNPKACSCRNKAGERGKQPNENEPPKTDSNTNIR